MTLRLEPLRVADAAEMAEVLSAPELYAVIGGSPPNEAMLAERYHHQVAGRSADGREEWLNWVIRVGGRAVGYVQATVHDDGRAEIAWVVGLPWQGRGYATAAARELVALLAARGVRQVEAHVRPGHVASETVAARVGLVATGSLDPGGEQLWLRAPGD